MQGSSDNPWYRFRENLEELSCCSPGMSGKNQNLAAAETKRTLALSGIQSDAVCVLLQPSIYVSGTGTVSTGELSLQFSNIWYLEIRDNKITDNNTGRNIDRKLWKIWKYKSFHYHLCRHSRHRNHLDNFIYILEREPYLIKSIQENIFLILTKICLHSIIK